MANPTIGWEKLWQDEELVKRWKGFSPLPEVIEMADRLETKGRRRVLDIGCGLGRHTVYLAARGFEVTATDNSPTALRKCQENLETTDLKASLVECDMTELPFAASSFDGVIASHVIHHTKFAELAKIIASVVRLLAEDGLFVWASPSTRHADCGQGQEIEPGTWVNPEHWEGGISHHYCTEAEVRELLGSFAIESLKEHDIPREGGTRWHWRVLARKL
jgi:tellurite methyltransferase